MDWGKLLDLVACIGIHAELVGSGPRVVLVHGNVNAGMRVWEAQRPLAERFTLVVVSRRRYPPNPRSSGSTSRTWRAVQRRPLDFLTRADAARRDRAAGNG
jgi:hypothetical protein